MSEGERLADTARRIEEALPGRVRRDVPFAELTTYRLGGPAAVLVAVENLGEVERLAGALDAAVPVLVVGRGSNLLVADQGFAGVAVTCRGELAGLTLERNGRSRPRVTAGGGMTLPALARQSAAAGLGGLEFYVGIPGTVGGAVRMNAGGHGRDTAAVLTRAWVADLAGRAALEERPAAGLDLAYRHSNVGASELVAAAEFVTVERDPAVAAAEIDEIVRWRRAHQPGGANAGSVFANPPGDSAGRIIDAAGLKGLRMGGTLVSERHANFFQAEGGAAAADVVALVIEVRRRVEAATGVRLRPELRLAAFAGMPGARPGAPESWVSAERCRA